MRRGQRRDPAAAQATALHLAQQRGAQAAAAQRIELTGVQFRTDHLQDGASAPGNDVLDIDIRDALGEHIVIEARPLDVDGLEALIPNFVERQLASLEAPPGLVPVCIPDPGGALSNEAYKKAVRCCMACLHPKPQLSLPHRLALCDWLSRVLKVSPALHQSALIAAEKANRELLLSLHQRLRELNKCEGAFDSEFPSIEAARAFRAEELAETAALIRQVQRQPRSNALLEVGVVDAKGLHALEGGRFKSKMEPYVQIALHGNGGRKRKNLKYHTHAAQLDRNNGSALFLEKAPSACLPNMDGVLQLKVRKCAVKVLGGPSSNIAGGEEYTRVPLAAKARMAKLLTSTSVGRVEKDLRDLGQAVIPTSLTFRLEPQEPRRSFLDCIPFGREQPPPGESGLPGGSPDSLSLSDPHRGAGPLPSVPVAGQLSVVVRFFEEQLGSRALQISRRSDGRIEAQGQQEAARSTGATAEFLGRGQSAAGVEGSPVERSQDLLGGFSAVTVPARLESANDGEPGGIDALPESRLLDEFPSYARMYTPHQMADEEHAFDQVLAVIWGAWRDATKEQCSINEAEVLDKRHSAMVKQMHTFYLDYQEGKVGLGVNHEPEVTYPTGNSIFPDVPSLLHHLVREVPLLGLAPDKSWWAVVQLVATRCRVRKQRRDLAVLGMLIKEWRFEFEYLRAVRGILQHLATAAGKSQLTWRELLLLRECNATICRELRALFEQGPEKLLKLSFEEAAATFLEMQNLLLVATDGDAGTWSPALDEIMLTLMGRGSVQRLRAGLPSNPKDTAYIQGVIRNVSTCTDELRVEAILSNASRGSRQKLAQHGAYVRYEVVKEQVLLAIEAHKPISYTAFVQVLEDTLYQHHYALRDKGLVGQERHLHDPLDSRQPLELIDIEQILEQPILNWINDLQQSTRQQVQNTLKLEREDSSIRKVVYNLNASLLEMLKSVQEALTKVSRRGMRARLPLRRYRVGQAMTDAFEGAIQLYSQSLCEEFVKDLERSSLSLCLWSMRLGANSTLQGSEDIAVKLLTDECAVRINSLWLLLSNHHEVERSIQTSVIKGLPFEAVQIDVDQFNLEEAQAAIKSMQDGDLGQKDHKSKGSDQTDDDISVVSESLSWEGADQGEVAQSVSQIMAKMHQAQHHIGNLVVLMISGVANAFAMAVSSFVHGMLLKNYRGSASEDFENDSLAVLCNCFSGELRTLNTCLNKYAFQLVLQTAWYLILASLENGVLHDNSQWVLANDAERELVGQVLESLAGVWHGGGEGLPEGLIDRTSFRLKTLLKLQGSSTSELRSRYKGIDSNGTADLGDLLESCEVRFAQQNVTLLGTYLISRSTLPISGQDLLRLLRQRQGDGQARAALDEMVAELGLDEIQAHMAVTSSEVPVCALDAYHKEWEATGKLFVFSEHLVFTNILSMAAAGDFRHASMQAASTAIKSSAVIAAPLKTIPLSDASAAAEWGAAGLVSQALSSDHPKKAPQGHSPALRQVIRRSHLKSVVQKAQQIQVTATGGLDCTFNFSRRADADELHSQLTPGVDDNTGEGSTASSEMVQFSLSSIEGTQALSTDEVQFSTNGSLVQQFFFSVPGRILFGSKAMIFVSQEERILLQYSSMGSLKFTRNFSNTHVSGMSVTAFDGTTQSTFQFKDMTLSEAQADAVSRAIGELSTDTFKTSCL